MISRSELLPEISGLEFFPDPLHRYRLNGDWLAHSVTGVVSDLSPYAKAQIERTKDQWLPRGLAGHAALEALLLGNTIHIPDEYLSIIEPLLEHSLWDGITLLGCEYRLCDERKSCGGGADFIFRGPRGRVVLGDLKTVGKPKDIDSRKPATAQLGGYLSMLIDHHPFLVVDKCITVVAGPGRTRVVVEEPDECLTAWDKAWTRFQLTQPSF